VRGTHPAANAKALADMEDFIVKIFPPAKPAAISTAKPKAAKPKSSAKARK